MDNDFAQSVPDTIVFFKNVLPFLEWPDKTYFIETMKKIYKFLLLLCLRANGSVLTKHY